MADKPVILVTRETLEASCRNNPLRRLVAEIERREGRLKIVDDQESVSAKGQ